MKNRSILRLAVALFVAGSCAAVPTDAWAIFSLSVDAARGGRDIRLEPASPNREARNEEVSVTITSTEAKQYRLRQTVPGPLTNERGEILPAGAIKIFSPSSVSGRLDIVFPTELRMGQDFIYTSDSTGTGVEFSIVFALDTTQIRGAGRYQTQLRYELEAVTGDVQVVTVIKNLIVEIDSEFDVKLRGVEGGTSVDFGRITKNRLSASDALELEIISNAGTGYKIYQELAQPPMSASGSRLIGDSISVRVAPSEGAPTAAKPLSTSRELLYASEGNRGSESVNIVYETAPLADQIAGSYATSLNLTVESDSSASAPKSFNVPLRLEIETILYLDIDSEGPMLNFGRFKQSGDSQTRRVRIKAYNNTGERYQITQVVSRPFTNEQGKALPQDQFVASMTGAQSGTMTYRSATPVKSGETVIFASDAKGTPESIDVDYTLTLPKDASGGSYSAEVTFSVSVL